MKLLGLAVVIVSLALSGLMVLAQKPAPTPERETGARADDPVAASLRAELAQLRAEVRALRAHSERRQHAAAAPAAAVPAPHSAAIDAPAAPVTDPHVQRLAELREQLDTAPRDFDAERTVTGQLDDAFARIDGLDVATDHVVCTADVCRISLAHAQVDSGMDFVARAMDTPLLAGEFIALPPREAGEATQLFVLSHSATE